MKKIRNLKKRILILLTLFILLDAAIIVLMHKGSFEINKLFLTQFTDTAMVFFMIFLFVLVLLCLVVLIIATLKYTIILVKNKRKEHRFGLLNEIDDKAQSYIIEDNSDISLADFCCKFRDFCADKLNLYYDIKTIRRFVAGLSITHLTILQGMSGTGKTSLAYAFGEFIENESVIVPVQPMWKERSDMIGYFNEFTRKFNETNLLRKMYEAGYSNKIYIVILDEVNISRIEYYFAEFLSLLELPQENKRYIDVVSDVWPDDPKNLKDGRILIPANMWFVGTANNDDSTFSISDKVYDRSMVITLNKRAKSFDASSTSCPISYKKLNDLFDRATEEHKISEELIHKIKKLDSYLIQVFGITFGNRIMSQFTSYIPVLTACGGSSYDAIDDIFTGKILRKLEQLNPILVKEKCRELIDVIDLLFGKENMPLSIEYIEEKRRQLTYVTTEQ